MTNGETEGDARPEPPESVSIRGLISAAGWLALLLTALSVVGQRSWPIELTTHFWPQLLLVLACSTVVFVRLHQTKVALAHAVGVVVLLTFVLPNTRLVATSEVEGSDLVALFINVETSNQDHALVLAAIRNAEPDVVGLAEINDEWSDALHDIRDDYPYELSMPRNDNFGIALLSRLPLDQGSVEFIGSSGLPSIFATVETDSGPWHIVVTHPIPPFNRFAFDSRNEQLAQLAEELSDLPEPKIVLGDLNSTLWSPYLRDFRRSAELRSGSAGPRAFYTWPAGAPILALGLDHCLHSRSARSTGYQVLAAIGSDHYPILCGFSR